MEVGSRFVRLTWKRGFDGNSPLLGYLIQYQVIPTGSDYKQIWSHMVHTGTVYNLTLGITSASLMLV